MRKVLMTGALIGLAAAAAILLSGVLGQSLQHLGVLAVVLGAVIALAAGRTWWGAPAGLGIGMLVAWVGYGLRALILPDAMSYGDGAVMGVPAHDERDFAFAKKYG